MAEGFFLAGLAANACVQAQGVTVTSEDTLFPKSKLQNGKPWEPYRFGNFTANQVIDFDCNVVFNSSLEVDADGVAPPSGWPPPSGSTNTNVSTTFANEGTKSMRLAASNQAGIQDFDVRAGGTYRVSVALRGDGTDIVSAYVLDLISGKWLLSNGTWSGTKTAFATQSAASFAAFLQTFTLEAAVPGHVGPAKIRLLFDRPGSITGSAYVDSIYLWPKITCAALLFDTIPTSFTVAVQSDDGPTFPSPTANGNMPAQRFRRYIIFNGPATLERYWRFLVTGTPYDLFRPWIGQLVLGERETFITKPSWGLVTARVMPKAGTKDLPASLAEAPRYRFDMSWESSYSAYRQIAEKMLGASRFGDEPVLVVADVADAEFVYGRGASMSSVDPRWVFLDVMDYSLSVEDDPYPVVTQ